MTAIPPISRRRALGLAAAGAGAVAATAIAAKVGLPTLFNDITSMTPGFPASGWPSALSTSRGLAAHLLRRAGFGATEPELEAASSMSYDDLVESVLAQQPQAMSMPANVTNHTAVVAAWYEHMATTPSPFPERMALFWHGVLTSDFRNSDRLPLVWQQLTLLREQGRGTYRDLLGAITFDPLMMRYLNLAGSTAAAPNENYARELMELFTLGPGNYTETDVREGARALSGGRIVLVDSGGARIPTPKYSASDPAAYVQQLTALVQGGARFTGVIAPKLHDSGSKTFLGRTGNLGPGDVLDTILAQPACAPFVTRRAMTYFATPNPSDSDVATIAAQFRSSGYDIRALMRAIFHSEAFTGAASYRSLVRPPSDLTVAMLRATGDLALVRPAMVAAPTLDQVLYDPPNVAGWPANSGWVSSGTVLGRINLAETASSARNLPAPAGVASTWLDGVLSAATQARYAAATTDPERWYALLASPEFQLK
ncbi:MAG: DUF1800 domain-containing protein [Candidatus Dormibacteria bacterium]